MGKEKEILMLVITCFACGKPIKDTKAPCPHCGYQFTADDNSSCPNKKFANCTLTGNLCQHSANYGKCPVKNEVEREQDY